MTFGPMIRTLAADSDQVKNPHRTVRAKNAGVKKIFCPKCHTKMPLTSECKKCAISAKAEE